MKPALSGPLTLVKTRAYQRFVTLSSRLQDYSTTVPVRSICLLWLVWIIFIHILPSILGGLYSPTSPDNADTVWPYYMEAIQTSLSRWDSRWFHEVVERGYYYHGPKEQSSIRFYPMFPYLIRFVKAITPLNTFQAGTVVSSLATLGSLILLADAVKKQTGKHAIFPTIEALILFPSAFILATVYSESTTLFFFLLAIRLAKADFFLAAGVAAFAAGISRINGFLIGLPLLVIAVTSLRTKWSWKPVVMLLVAGLGAIAFPCYLWIRFKDPLLYFHIQDNAWTQSTRPFYTFLKEVFLAGISAVVDHKVPLQVDSTGMNLFPLNFGALCLMFWSLRASVLKKRWDDVALLAGACLIAASAGNLLSLPRIAIIYYPLTLRLGEATAENPALRFVVSFAFLSLQALVLLLFVRWIFVF